MKQAINFRLSEHAIMILSLLSESQELPKTEIVERALQRYFERKSAKSLSPLMKFAGILSDEEADDMLESIYSNRVDSDREINL